MPVDPLDRSAAAPARRPPGHPAGRRRPRPLDASRRKASTILGFMRSMAGSTSARMRLRSACVGSRLVGSTAYAMPAASSASRRSPRRSLSSGRMILPLRAGMPRSPRRPLPRTMRSRMVSARSSAVWAVTMSAPARSPPPPPPGSGSAPGGPHPPATAPRRAPARRHRSFQDGPGCQAQRPSPGHGPHRLLSRRATRDRGGRR